MADARLPRQLVHSAADVDLAVVRGASEEVSAAERQKQHLLANDLEGILNGRPAAASSPTLQRLVASVPKDRERGFPLLTLGDPDRGLDDIVLSRQNRSTLEEWLREHSREDLLLAHGLRPVNRMLLCGPAGCGKTLAAEVLARELGRPFAIVRTVNIVSSLPGETAANLRRVFDFVSSTPLVALFDDFDARGNKRDDRSEHDGLRRVANAVLQMFDVYEGRSIIIAATNYDGMLGPAIWRRFDEALHLDKPTRGELRALLTMKLRGLRHSFDVDDVLERGWFEGATHALVERVLLRAVKNMVLEGDSQLLTMEHVDGANRRESAGLQRVAAPPADAFGGYGGQRSPSAIGPARNP